MSSKRPASCRVCHGHESVVGRISWRGKCAVCGDALHMENTYGLRTDRDLLAPEDISRVVLRWRRGMARGIGGILLDDLEAGED